MNQHSNANDTAQYQAVPLPPMLFDLDGTLVDSAINTSSPGTKPSPTSMDVPNWKIHRRVGMNGSFFPPGLLRKIGHSTNSAAIKRLEKRHAKYFT